MIQQDRLEIEKADAKNSVEEYVYDMRDKVETSLRPYINDEVCILYVLMILIANDYRIKMPFCLFLMQLKNGSMMKVKTSPKKCMWNVSQN